MWRLTKSEFELNMKEMSIVYSHFGPKFKLAHQEDCESNPGECFSEIVSLRNATENIAREAKKYKKLFDQERINNDFISKQLAERVNNPKVSQLCESEKRGLVAQINILQAQIASLQSELQSLRGRGTSSTLYMTGRAPASRVY